jgi:hypothetical protein
MMSSACKPWHCLDNLGLETKHAIGQKRDTLTKKQCFNPKAKSARRHRRVRSKRRDKRGARGCVGPRDTYMVRGWRGGGVGWGNEVQHQPTSSELVCTAKNCNDGRMGARPSGKV